MFLIWRRDATAKGTKKDTPPNVTRLHNYILLIQTNLFLNVKL